MENPRRDDPVFLLLTDIIEKDMKLRRADVWIGNVIKCRPPQNRKPEPGEIPSCQPLLEALRNAAGKKEVWEDMKVVLGRPVPGA